VLTKLFYHTLQSSLTSLLNPDMEMAVMLLLLMLR
jgi:hypothetical protein